VSGEISYRVTVGGYEFDVTLEPGDDRMTAQVGGERLRVAWQPTGSHSGVLRVDERATEVLLAEGAAGTGIVLRGYQAEAQVVEARALQLAASLPRRAAGSERIEIRAPMPGRVVSVRVGVGETVQRNTLVAILEAMKMENELRAPGRGRVSDVRVAEGDTVEHGALLMVLDPAGGE
jgi:biotin carboxyl carrier protein